jgi:hypothetical protein
VALDQDGSGHVLLVTLDDRGGRRRVSIEPRRVGQTRTETLDLDVGAIHSQPDLIDRLGQRSDSNLALNVRLTGLYPDDLDLDLDEIERALSPSFLRFRVRDLSIPNAPDGPLPPPDTVLGAFVRGIEERIAALETGIAPDASGSSAGPGPDGPGPDAAASVTAGDVDAAAEEVADLREVLRLGRHLLEGRQVTL